MKSLIDKRVAIGLVVFFCLMNLPVFLTAQMVIQNSDDEIIFTIDESGSTGIGLNIIPTSRLDIGGTLLLALNAAADRILVCDDEGNAAWTDIGGDLAGAANQMTVTGLQGKSLADLSSLSDGDILTWNETAQEWQPGAQNPETGGNILSLTAGTGLSGGGTEGDVPLAAHTQQPLWNAGSIQGTPVSPDAPVDLAYPGYDGSGWKAEYTARDAIYNASHLGHIPVSPGEPSEGDLLSYDGSEWTPAATLFNASKLQETPLQIDAPATGEFLAFDGSNFTSQYHVNDHIWNVNRLRTFPVFTDNAVDNGILRWANSRWEFSASPDSAVFDADRFHGTPIMSTAPGQNQFLLFNGAAFVPGPRPGDDVWNCSSLQGYPVSTSAPAVSHFLVYSSGQWQYDYTPHSAIWNVDRFEGVPVSTDPPVVDAFMQYVDGEFTATVRSVDPVWNVKQLQSRLVFGSPQPGQILKWNGAYWASQNDRTAMVLSLQKTIDRQNRQIDRLLATLKKLEKSVR